MIKKFSLIFITTFLLLICFCCNVFSYSVTTDNKTFEIEDKYYQLALDHEFYGKKDYLIYVWGNLIGLWFFDDVGSSKVYQDPRSGAFGLIGTTNLAATAYIYNKNTFELVSIDKNMLTTSSNGYNFSYQFASSLNIYKDNSFSNLFYKTENALNVFNLSLNVETDVLNHNLVVSTNKFIYSDKTKNYKLYMSYNNADNFESVGSIATHNDVQNNKFYIYLQYVPKNQGLYYFRLYDPDLNRFSNTQTLDVSDVILGDVAEDKNIPKPDFIIQKNTNGYILKTQWLEYTENTPYHLYLSKNNGIFINSNSVLDTMNDVVSNKTYYRYTYNLSEIASYKFVFYDTTTQKFSEYTYIQYNGNLAETPIEEEKPDESINSLEFELKYDNLPEYLTVYSQYFNSSTDDVFYNIQRLDEKSNTWKIFESLKEYNGDNSQYRFVFNIDKADIYHLRISKKIGDIVFCGTTSTLNATSFVFANAEEDNPIIAKMNKIKDRFGFLVYPFEFILDLCTRFLTINFDTEPKIYIPDIYLPDVLNYEEPFIHGLEFNFNDYLKNDTFKNIHNIYMVIVGGGICFGMIYLFYRKISEVLHK